MVYKYRGKETIEAELERIHAEKEATKQRLKERNTLLQQLRREQRRLDKLRQEEASLETQIRSITVAPRQLPPPLYGGRAGLKAAAKEAHGHDPKRESRKRKTAA
jgi:chromosome segregation ATPase